MACTQCTTKFNFFHKELGCSNCGLSFCSKCLQQKCQIPSKGTSAVPVCKQCYSKLTAGITSPTPMDISPPDRFLKRIENLNNPSEQPIKIYKPSDSQSRKGLSQEDQKLIERLEKLEDDNKGPIPTESELRKRLAKLKDLNEDTEQSSKASVLPTVDKRLDSEKVDSLLEQFMNETNMEVMYNPQDETVDPVSSDEEVSNITKRVMAEVSLDSGLSSQNNPIRNEDTTSSPELPWCVLCNNDAKYRCIDCSGDLYCHECNIEVHKNWGDKDHQVVLYKQSS